MILRVRLKKMRHPWNGSMPVRLEHLRFAWNGSNLCQFMINVSKYPTHRASETIHAAKYSMENIWEMPCRLSSQHHVSHVWTEMKLSVSSGVAPPLVVPPFRKT